MFAASPKRLVALCSALPGSGYLFCDELIEGDSYYVRAAFEKDNHDHWSVDLASTVPILDQLLPRLLATG
jgi:hypothetical protein